MVRNFYPMYFNGVLLKTRIMQSICIFAQWVTYDKTSLMKTFLCLNFALEESIQIFGSIKIFPNLW